MKVGVIYPGARNKACHVANTEQQHAWRRADSPIIQACSPLVDFSPPGAECDPLVGSPALAESEDVAFVEGCSVSLDQAPDAPPDRVSDCAAFLRR